MCRPSHSLGAPLLDALRAQGAAPQSQYMEVVGCKTEAGSCTLRPGPGAMLFHGISGDHIQGIMEEMERRSKTESRLAKGMQLNGRESVRAGVPASCGQKCGVAVVSGDRAATNNNRTVWKMAESVSNTVTRCMKSITDQSETVKLICKMVNYLFWL